MTRRTRHTGSRALLVCGLLLSALSSSEAGEEAPEGGLRRRRGGLLGRNEGGQRQYGQGRARAMDLESLLVMPGTAPEQA